MTCQFAFLDVENADCIVVAPAEGPAVVVDVPQPQQLLDWLNAQGVTELGHVYVTHFHDDHIKSVEALVQFLAKWRGAGRVHAVALPEEAVRHLCDRMREFEKKPDYAANLQYQRLKDTLARLLEWSRKPGTAIGDVDTNHGAYRSGPLAVEVLFPTFIYDRDHRSRRPGKLNERSRVLRVTYGSFAALLLADIEGEGLSQFLKDVDDAALAADLVKIPHHGAWPANGDELGVLLERASARTAILSVGSRNRYRHVRPELFSALVDLQTRGRLEEFVCTEVTRTCVSSATERAAAGHNGLSMRRPCAGTIVIDVWPDGTSERRGRSTHDATIDSVERPACRGLAQLRVTTTTPRTHLKPSGP